MILILAEPGDAAALWLRGALKPFFSGPVRVLTPARLIYAPSIVQRMDTRGGTIRITLDDGEELDFAAVRGVVNRLATVPMAHLDRAEPADRLYAATELHAFLLGLLASLSCPLLNSPAPEWLAGPHHSEIGALHLAVAAGLRCPARVVDASRPAPPVRDRRADTAHVVLDDQVIGPVLPARWRDALLQFARGWGARLVQIETREEDGQRIFVAASSLVDFPRGGGVLVRAVARALGA